MIGSAFMNFDIHYHIILYHVPLCTEVELLMAAYVTLLLPNFGPRVR